MTLVLCGFAAEHKFYMSLTDVSYNDRSSSLELTSRFFTDDVERAISSDERLLKIDESMDEDLLPLIQDFYMQGIALDEQDEKIDLTFIGYEVENELFWCYAEAQDMEKVEQLKVSGKWLFDLFDSQVNIINVHIGEVRSAYLNVDDSSHLFELK